MANPRQNMKRKKQQSINALANCVQYMVDILTILEYEPEYLHLYIDQILVLREMVKLDPAYSLIQYYEMIRKLDDTLDLGSRYSELIKIVDLFIDTKLLEQKWIETRL